MFGSHPTSRSMSFIYIDRYRSSERKTIEQKGLFKIFSTTHRLKYVGLEWVS